MPVDHSLSPAMHNAAYDELGLDWVYVPLGLTDEAHLSRVLPALKALPFVGFNVTMPFKQAVLDHCDEVSLLARMAGAVNAVHCVDGRFVGYNTDGRGLLESLAQEVAFSPRGENVTIVGAGGAAGAAAVSFVVEKASRVAVVNRTIERAEELVERLRPYACATELLALELPDAREQITESKLIVNATSVGMEPDDPSPLPGEWLHSHHIVCDMIYRTAQTSLLRDALAAGAVGIGGLGMLVHQAALAIDIWNESLRQDAPRDVMRLAAESAMRKMRASGGIE